MDFAFQFTARDGTYRVHIEDDGKTCYGYLLRHEEIVGDVWIYNRAPTPEEPEWPDRAAAPYLNPRAFAKADVPFALPENGAPFTCEWSSTRDGKPVAAIALDGMTVAILVEGKMPGWSLAAARTGPLAIPLEGLNPADI